MNIYRYHTLATRIQHNTLKQFNSVPARISLLSVALFFVVLYVFQTSAIATRGYAIAELERDLHGLEVEQKKLDVQLAENQSLQQLEERLGDMKFVATSDITYVGVADTSFALR